MCSMDALKAPLPGFMRGGSGILPGDPLSKSIHEAVGIDSGDKPKSSPRPKKRRQPVTPVPSISLLTSNTDDSE